jgi:tyrosyl-tRNA synthetase
VWLDPGLTSPYDFFQYFVNVDDRDVVRFLKLLTFEPLEEIRRFETAAGADLREAKRLLAHAVTTIVHGESVANDVQNAARAAFGTIVLSPVGGASHSRHGAVSVRVDPPEMLAALPTVTIDGARLLAGLKIVDLVAESGLASSKSAARRLIEQGGVRVGERKIASVDDVLTEADVADGVSLLHVGKKHVRRLVRG